MKSLSDWLEQIEQFHPSEIEMGLDRLLPVAERLGVLNKRCPVITVAGTNGKGSTIALCEALARSQGLAVGVYTSPHIHHFNERVRINGIAVTDAELTQSFEHVETARQDVPLTYFEFTTLAALHCFSKTNLDVLLLEIGLGGRLDAVNIVDPDVAVVTSIGLDHMAWLGDTREKIAQEKCGIARAETPLIYGEYDRPATVDRCALEAQARLLCAGRDFLVEPDRLVWLAGLDDTDVTRTISFSEAVHLGRDNLLTAIQALALLDIHPESEQICRVAEQTRLPGRHQLVMHDNVPWLFDVGHNAEAIARLVSNLPAIEGATVVIMGMMGDKPATEAMASLSAIVSQWHLLSLPAPRGLSAAQLAPLVPAKPEQVHCHNQAQDAVAMALENLQPDGRVLVIGSFVTVAAVAEAIKINLFEVRHQDQLAS